MTRTPSRRRRIPRDHRTFHRQPRIEYLESRTLLAAGMVPQEPLQKWEISLDGFSKLYADLGEPGTSDDVFHYRLLTKIDSNFKSQGTVTPPNEFTIGLDSGAVGRVPDQAFVGVTAMLVTGLKVIAIDEIGPSYTRHVGSSGVSDFLTTYALESGDILYFGAENEDTIPKVLLYNDATLGLADLAVADGWDADGNTFVNPSAPTKAIGDGIATSTLLWEMTFQDISGVEADSTFRASPAGTLLCNVISQGSVRPFAMLDVVGGADSANVYDGGVKFARGADVNGDGNVTLTERRSSPRWFVGDLAVALASVIPDADGFSTLSDPAEFVTQRPTSKLGDFVWEDVNANGIQDDGDTGLDGITVNLYDAGNHLVSTQLTAGGGQYLFTGLTPGDYHVEFVAPGWMASSADQGANDAEDSDGLVAATTTLVSGETDRSWDQGLYHTAGLGDLVWLDLNSNGKQDDGEPGVSGITVILLDSGGNPLAGQTTTTDTNGFYQFTGLLPGTYGVHFVLPPGYVFTRPNAPGTRDAEDSDADQVTGKTGNYTLSSGQYDETVDAGLLLIAPGIEIVKDAGSQIVAPNTPVTFTYSVRNTGGLPVSNIVVTDDNATPDFTGDDFVPAPVTQSAADPHPGKNIGDLNGDDRLDPAEIWKYSAAVIPPVKMTVTVTTGATPVPSGLLSYQVLANGDIRVFYRQNNLFNDNSYGTGSDVGWTSQGKTHKFGDLTGSDKAGFEVRDTNGTVLFKFYQDYITASATNIDGYASYSGYQSLGYSSGDGSLQTGGSLNAQAATYLYDFDSTLETNLNQPGIANNGVAYTAMTINSPTNGVSNPLSTDPKWDVVDGYSFVIRSAAFNNPDLGTGGFGGARIFDQHNSPAKIGDSNTYLPEIKCEASVNTATVTGWDGSTQLEDDDDASVELVCGPLGSLGDRVWYDTNANGVQNAGELGISGVTVLLEGDFDQNGTIDYTATATTGADGLYTFTGLPAGEYLVTVDVTTLPANYTQTYDLDGLATPNTALGELASGQNRTDFDFGYVATAPGFSLEKTADKTTAAFGEPITYTYVVRNTGAQPLTNLVLTDDNGTPDNPGDDFVLSSPTGDTVNPGTLDPGETWTYTTTVTPPIQLTANNVNGYTGPAGTLTSQVLANGDIRISYRQSANVNDNTYGTGAAADWPSGHKFGDLTGSDKAGFEIKDTNGTVLFKFYQDYITASATNLDGYASYSGYQSLGYSGGDGSLQTGGSLNGQAATYLYDFDTTLETNLNQPGTANNGVAYTGMVVNSPVNDLKWDVVDGYSFVIKASAFNNATLGTGGFGSVRIFDQHNSPSKLGVNSFEPTPSSSEVTNTAVVTATLGGSTVVARDDATVVVGPGGGGAAKFFVVDLGADDTFRYSATGTSVGNFALQAGNTDPRDVASNADGSGLWVLDKDKNVNVYDGAGAALGVWKADGLGREPEGITLDGNDLWMASRDRKIVWYDGAASNLTGTDKNDKSFAPSMSGNLKGIVADGTNLWVVTENATDYVYRFTITRDGSGNPTGLTQSGQWKLATANSKPTGITLDTQTPGSLSLWIVDESTDTVYEYGTGRGLTDGTGSVSTSFKLASPNLAPQGIADPQSCAAADRRVSGSVPHRSAAAFIDVAAAGLPRLMASPAAILGREPSADPVASRPAPSMDQPGGRVPPWQVDFASLEDEDESASPAGRIYQKSVEDFFADFGVDSSLDFAAIGRSFQVMRGQAWSVKLGV